MKIEKINDNQIRCTLTRSDLEQRELNLSELAYGTKKAQALFSEMIRYASSNYGFKADGSPMMVEAVPISSDTIILILSKVTYPDELDTRFANFSKNPGDHIPSLFDGMESQSGPTSLGKEKHSASEALEAARASSNITGDLDPEDDETIPPRCNDSLKWIFSFSSIDDLFDLANVLLGYIRIDNTLYHVQGEAYYLVLKAAGSTPTEYNKLCNVISEYGTQCTLPGGAEHYFGEHRKPLLAHNALQQLSIL